MSPRILALVTEGIEVGKIERDIQDVFRIHVGSGYESLKLTTESWARG